MGSNELRTILLVDSDPASLELLQRTLGQTFTITHASNSQQGLEIAEELLPCMVITATQGEALDGFRLCRQIRDEISMREIPVVLLSDGDLNEARLQGFDAGAEDCVARNIEPKQFATRLTRIIKLAKKREAVREQIQYANMTAMTAMTSLSETGLVIEGIKRYNQCHTAESLGRALLDSCEYFDLHGAVQIDLGGEPIALNRNGLATELEQSILQQLTVMDRITQFRNRLFIHYPRVCIVINNLPLEDPDRCGRLRDHLAMLVEAADIRAGSLLNATQAHSRGEAISHTIEALTATLSGIDHLQRQGRADTSSIRAHVLIEVEHVMSGMGLSEQQESAILRVVQQGLETLADMQLAEAHLQDELSAAISCLKKELETSSPAHA